MDLTAEEDAAIGQEMYCHLHRLLDRMATKYQLPADRMTDFLLAGALFVAATRYDLSIDQTVEVVEGIARSVQDDDLPTGTRH